MSEAPLGEVELAPAPRLRSAAASYVQLARIEGYGNPKTGELWMRAVPLVDGFQGFEVGGPRDARAPEPKAPSGVGVSGQELGRVAGFCEAEYEADGVPNNNPNGTLEFYNQYDATGNAVDQSSFVPATCYSKLDAEFQTAIHSSLFSSQGVGCAYQHVGNFTGVDYNRLLLDVDVFNGSLATHGPYGPPFTTGTVTTPEGRNAPYQDLGLWDFGPMPSGNAGQTTGPHLKNMWVYFKNGDSNDFNWTGYILGEVFETCGDDDDDDCDGVDDNGCGLLADTDDCYSDSDCASGRCEGAVIVSGQGEGGGDLGDDTAGTCTAPQVQVSAGYDSTCRVTSNGVECWGDPADATTTSEPGGVDHVQLSAGTYHACTLRGDGTITCWGDPADGRATSQSATDHIAVSAGGFHNCALHADSTVSCWGNNAVGQAPAFAGGDFAALSAGYDFTCGIKHNGSIECWGSPVFVGAPPVNRVFRSLSSGPYHACAIDSAGDVSCWGEDEFAKLIAPAGTFTQVAAGFNHNCGLKTDGSLACWGDNFYGQATPPVGTDYVSVVSGQDHSCAVKVDDSIVCWGKNDLGQTTVPITPVVPTPELQTLSTGWFHGCAITSDGGKLKCWGQNAMGYDNFGYAYAARAFQALGSESPDRTLGSSPALQTSTGNAHTCVLFADQSVRCIGSNNHWQSRGSAGSAIYAEHTAVSPPAALDIGGLAVKVLAGAEFTCALREDGALVCWGYNAGAQLGLQSAAGDVALVAGGASNTVPLGVPVADFCVGVEHACALLQDGNVRCWGNSYGGQLGLGNTSKIGDDEAVTSVPAVQVLTSGEISAGRSVAQIACGGAQTCAVLDDGKMRCWGDNTSGTLGYGSASLATSIGDNEHPNTAGYVNIGAGELVAQVTTADDVTCSLSQTGQVKCWGWTQRSGASVSCLGQPLGCGSTINSPPASAINFGAGRTAVELAHRSRGGLLCARLDDDGIKCWHTNGGTNVYACGIGSTISAVAIPNGAYTLPPSERLADLVLGQSEVAGAYTDGAQGANRLYYPEDVAFDPASGKVFVADSNNNRVLRYGSYAALKSGADAERVFGQANFTGWDPNRGGSVAANTMSEPRAVVVDAAGTLWVSDFENHRVLRFDNAATVASNGPAANGVLGQTSFTTASPGTSSTQFNFPSGLAMAADGTLWVGDFLNHRVLRFNNAPVLADADGGAASVVLGQADFSSNTGMTAQARMYYPQALHLDGAGRLWVADMGSNRVLRFDAVASKVSGANANGVLGQTTFNTYAYGLSATAMDSPAGLVVSAAGTLYVGDNFNSRVLVFPNAAALANGAAASRVIGAADFVTPGGGGAGDQMETPWGLELDPSGGLWVSERSNNRVTMYLP